MSNINRIKENPSFSKMLSSENFEDIDCQKTLYNYYTQYLGPPDVSYKITLSEEELNHIRQLEKNWNDYEESRIKKYLIPSSPREFTDWYESLRKLHNEQESILFDFIQNEASIEEIAYYVYWESKVDGRFDDLIALAQIGLDGKPKLVIAENYWDEMGRGKIEKMHTYMFCQSANYLTQFLKPQYTLEGTPPLECLKNSNLLMKYAIRREFSPRLLGALGILEDTATNRFKKITEGMRRVNLPKNIIAYYLEHIKMDETHGNEWKTYVFDPLVNKGDILLIKEIAKGALIRYNVAIDYYRAINTILIDTRVTPNTLSM